MKEKKADTIDILLNKYFFTIKKLEELKRYVVIAKKYDINLLYGRLDTEKAKIHTEILQVMGCLKPDNKSNTCPICPGGKPDCAKLEFARMVGEI